MEYDLTDIKTVKSLLGAAGFTFSKSLGQNFITDPGVCPKMAELAGIGENDGVIEIGPGVGVLTVELAKRAEKVVSIELDTRLFPVLAKTLSEKTNVFVENADILKTDLRELIKKYFREDQKIHVCANLPYYITSPIIIYLLESGIRFSSLTLMVQKEAGERITAKLGQREAGALTAAVQYKTEANKLFDVKSSSFTPPPKVNSSVIKLTFREKPPVEIESEEKFFRTVKAVFAHRRKTAVNSLSAETGISKEKITSALASLGFPPTVRAEEIDIEKMAQLSKLI
ncbi:MAG: 16S rRNA (adenine(1518)-N(6)/adenine(1519)-N(6))-dimethyltransferase RsmA [Oscillospiraceae bacterium]|nr:16S rRNA (adenine(1518)-N(6)/adenine(1519)-N(6))-dimethyltransferase RsmA [Oscillospiraceae bacterium]